MNRICVIVLLLVGGVQAQEGFKGKTKVVSDAEGQLQVTVPDGWQTRTPAGAQLLNIFARHGGGHNLIVVREGGQSDVDKQRDRYIEYDGGNYPGAEIKKYAKPFFGYRLNHPQKNRTLLRSFVSDGSDGLVVTLSSRFQNYDANYLEQNLAIISSLKMTGGGGASARPELAGESRRIFGANGIVSLVAPGAWKPMETDEESQLLFLGLKGTKSGPVITIVDEGSPTNPNLVLISISNSWKKAYGQISRKRLSNNPPTLLVRNRKAGWIDYILAFGAGDHGYTLRLAVREGSFERFKSLADQIYQSVVVMGGPFKPGKDLPGDITVEHKKAFTFHVSAENSGAVDKIAKELAGFSKNWSRIGIGDRKRPPPIPIVVVEEDGFDKASHGFGDSPAAYERLGCSVVVLKKPSDKDAVASWRGRLYAALAEASMHRDLKVATPPWLLAGLSSCMDAAGRGKSSEDAHPGLVKLLELKTATDAHAPLKDVLLYTYGDVLRSETPTNLTMAWGYTHLMLYGKTTLSSIYKKFIKALEKTKGKMPELDLRKYDKAEEDLKKHVFRNWGK